jgi:hypothetical protein
MRCTGLPGLIAGGDLVLATVVWISTSSTTKTVTDLRQLIGSWTAEPIGAEEEDHEHRLGG